MIDAHQKGVVVHVLRSHRVIDPTYILYLLRGLHLPTPDWMHDHYEAKLPPTTDALAETLAAHQPALLFLRRPRTLMNPSSTYSGRHVEQLVALQRQMDKPILLLPEALHSTMRAIGIRRTIIDGIFGNRESPGRLRELLGFFWMFKHARFHVGAPVNIKAVLEREKGQTDRVIAKKIRWSILHHLAREDRMRTGPLYRPAARTRQMVLKDPQLKRYIESESQAAPRLLERKADELLQEMASDIRYGWLRVVDAAIDLIWKRIYDGIVVDKEGLAKVRRAARKGPVILVPSHKSHIDYLILSQVFMKDGMLPPHIAAGNNLNFPPMGLIFRRTGAFFLRRSFKGDELYTQVFMAYIRRLLKEGHALEFFIEGGRSRTGKLLPPRMGLLGMICNPVLDGVITDLSFIPISISYEKVIEAGSYRKELEGGKKKKEDVAALLQSTKVLRSRYGRVYVDFDDPLSLRVYAASRGFSSEQDESQRRGLINQLGHRIVWGINHATRVTPTSVASLVLLARTRRGIGEEDLYLGADLVIDFLYLIKARVSSVLLKAQRRPAIREAIGRLAQDGLVQMLPAPDGETVYQLDEEGRRALDYYKNNILHFFVPYSVAAMAMLNAQVEGKQQVANTELIERVRRLSHLLKDEFSFGMDRGLKGNVEDVTDLMHSRGLLAQVELPSGAAGWSIPKSGLAEAKLLAGLIAVFFEAHRLTAEALEEVQNEALPEKRLIQLALMRGKKQILEGRMGRPEGASSITIKASLRLFAKDGLTEEIDGDLKLRAPDQRAALIEELNGYLRR